MKKRLPSTIAFAIIEVLTEKALTNHGTVLAMECLNVANDTLHTLTECRESLYQRIQDAVGIYLQMPEDLATQEEKKLTEKIISIVSSLDTHNIADIRDRYNHLSTKIVVQ